MENIPLAADDIGFLSGVVIVDRLRTIAGVGLDVAEHVRRFEQSCQGVGIDLPPSVELMERVALAVEQHRPSFAPRDFSLVMLATPGRQSTHPARPTLIFQATAIDWQRLAKCYMLGQRLGMSTVRNVPAECWSPAIKTRARLHYYLADRQIQLDTGDRYSAAVLGDMAGNLTETSMANLLIVEGEHLLTPRRDKILDGISLRRTFSLASGCGYCIGEADISPERAEQADAILLCGSTGCLWPASHFGTRAFARPTEQPVYQRLSQAWQAALKFDYVQQALNYARSVVG